eukprot:2157879-Prymnesium_polylepis.1
MGVAASQEEQGRKFGCEYELGFPRRLEATDANYRLENQRVAAELQRLTGLDVRYVEYTHQATPYWKLVRDVSIGFGGSTQDLFAIELVSPILQGEDGLNQVYRMIQAVAACGGKVNKTVGHHVHIDGGSMSLEEKKKVCVAFIAYEKVFDLMTSKSRQESRWCKSNQEMIARNNGGSVQAALNAIQRVQSLNELVRVMNNGGDRYYKLNLTNLTGGNGHGTLEFRMHQ